MKIPFSPPDITEEEIAQVSDALKSGWITTGPKTKELEREVADLCGVNRAVCNMTDVVAGIGLAQMKRYKGLLARRKEIIGKYDAAFKPLGIEVLDHYTDEHQSSGHLYITKVPGITLEQRHEIIVKMAEAGIACNVHYKPLPMMTAYKNLGFDIKDYPNAYKRFENEITLPLHTRLKDEEVEYVIEQYCKIVKEYI